MKMEMEVKKECDLEESRLVGNLLVTNAECIHQLQVGAVLLLPFLTVYLRGISSFQIFV